MAEVNTPFGLIYRQIEQLSDERMLLRQSLDRNIKKKSEERDRAELLSTDKATLEDYSKGQHLETQNQSLKNSHGVVEKIKDMGSGVLNMLGEQRETLKDVQSRMYDIGVMAGISHSTMKMAQRRDVQDKLIAGCCMFLVVILLIVVWYWKFW
jgi:phage-related tail protein